jgi:hypothetical protein
MLNVNIIVEMDNYVFCGPSLFKTIDIAGYYYKNIKNINNKIIITKN